MFHRSKNILNKFKILVKFSSSIKENNVNNTILNEFFNKNNLYFDNNYRKTKFDDKSIVLKNTIGFGLSNTNDTHKHKSIKYQYHLSDKFEG